MIVYLTIIYLGIISVVLVDPNPLWTLPLVAVVFGEMFKNKWLSLLGILIFSAVSIGRYTTGSFTDMLDLILMTITLIIPVIFLLEVTLAPRPYKVRRLSVVPLLISGGMVIAFFGVLLLIMIAPAPYDRIGLYLSSDPVLQVFMLMSLSILFTGPVLLGSSPPDDQNTARGAHSQHDTIKTNK
jgi:hypothetical protein